MRRRAIGADVLANISAREVATEPMYIIMNLGISHGFGDVSELFRVDLELAFSLSRTSDLRRPDVPNDYEYRLHSNLPGVHTFSVFPRGSTD